MAEQTVRQSKSYFISLSPPPTQRHLPWLLVLFVGSGCAALIYEIVWFQLLELVIGSSAISLGVLLGTFMGGMCLGGLLLPRFASPIRHPLRVYAALEAGTGILGLLALVIVPFAGRAYIAASTQGTLNLAMRAFVCAICLLPPTLLMGATLPAIARWVETTPKGVSWLGFFYGSNIAGAVFGCLLAGFYLLRVEDMRTTTVIGALMNFAVASIGFALSLRTPYHGGQTRPQRVDLRRLPSGTRAIHVAIGLSGFAALGGEVVWTRLLSLLLGTSVYTFSIILSVFLIALGFGSSAGSFMARRWRPAIALGWMQLSLTLAIAWTGWMIASNLPYWPIDPSLARSPWITFQLDLLRSALAVFPAAFLWGASFPLAIAAVVSPGQDAGRTVGRIYAANTLGGIAGSLAFSVFIIPLAGTVNAERVLIALAMLSSIVVFASSIRSEAGRGRRMEWLAGGVTIGISALLVTTIPKIPDGLVAFGRYLPTRQSEPEYLYVGEGTSSSIAVTEQPNGIRSLHVAGKIEGSNEPQDMRLQRMLGHLSAFLGHDPKSVLVIGFGSGVTAGSFVLHPEIKRIVICEIDPLVPRAVSRYFTNENYNVINDPRVEIVYDDARHFILTTKEKFDVITSDPVNPLVKGAATLYTKEYFELVKQRLNPGGVVTQWVPLAESVPDVVRSELATFFDVFPDGTVWNNDRLGHGYDLMLAGHATPETINVDSIARRMVAPGDGRVAQSLREVGLGSTLGLLSTYGGRARDLAPWLNGAQINRDSNLRLQYLAGLGLNTDQGASIYEEMLKYRSFPESLFVGSAAERDSLRRALSAAAGP